MPEYLKADAVTAIIRAAANPKAKLLMLEQWRAGLRVSIALDLEVRDISLDTPNLTIRVRSGKGDFGEGVDENTLGGWSQVRSRLALANPTSHLLPPTEKHGNHHCPSSSAVRQAGLSNRWACHSVLTARAATPEQFPTCHSGFELLLRVAPVIHPNFGLQWTRIPGCSIRSLRVADAWILETAPPLRHPTTP